MSDSANSLPCAFHAFLCGHVPRRGSQHQTSDLLFVTLLGMRARRLMRAGFSRDEIAVRLIEELSASDPEQQPDPEAEPTNTIKQGPPAPPAGEPEPDSARGITRFLAVLFWH